MEDKESYTPQEVAEICKAYRKVRGGFDSAGVNTETIREYENTVPENVRDVIFQMNQQERSRLNKILSEE